MCEFSNFVLLFQRCFNYWGIPEISCECLDFFLFLQKFCWDFDRDDTESICFEYTDIIAYIKSSNSWTWDGFPFISVLFYYFSNTLYFTVCKSLSSMFKFIPKYLTLFDAIVNGINCFCLVYFKFLHKWYH